MSTSNKTTQSVNTYSTVYEDPPLCYYFTPSPRQIGPSSLHPS